MARTFINHAAALLSVQIAREREALGVTPEHPFYVRAHGARSDTSGEGDDDPDSDKGQWTAAQDLRPGDEVRRPDGTWARVEAVEQRTGGATVYNFEVAHNHNYFVGKVGTLVHNTCPRGLTQQQFDEYVMRYAAQVDSDLGLEWTRDVAVGLTSTQKSRIGEEAVRLGLLPSIPVDPVTRFADFGDNVILELQLPAHLWNRPDGVQFRFLDSLIGGHDNKFTWHHHQDPGRMQLVRRGIHDAAFHYGGRNIWALGPR